jgi:carboxypeptidase C (cathepsin A)
MAASPRARPDWPVLLAAVLLCSFTGGAAAQGAASSATAPGAEASLWQGLLQTDLAFVRDTLQTRHIYAIHPGGAEWQGVFDPALARAEAASAAVTNFAGYRAVLSRFISEFVDPHLRLVFNLQPARPRWPGVALRSVNGRYLVAASRVAGITAGAEVTACDGRPVDDWLDELAMLEIGIPGLEATRSWLAPRLLVDVGNPFWTLPQACTIAGQERRLDWTTIATEAWAAVAAPAAAPELAPGLSILEGRAAWIRLPSMTPRSQAQADSYHDVIRRAPGLRDHDVVVFDVRGNGGGSYNWFMAMLRALYGADFASYYARERLRITPVFVADTYRPGSGASADPFATPPDEDLNRVIDDVRPRALPGGATVTVVGASDDRRRVRPQSQPPPNPVKARVYVLTDGGCGSSCLSFVDELRQFPGVQQIGAATSADRRSGTPLPHALPSGLGTLIVPSMVRENRARGENEPWLPTLRFAGDVSDTAAVQRWVLEQLAPAGATGTSASAIAAPVVTRHQGVFGGRRVSYDAVYEEAQIADSKGVPAAIMSSFSYIERSAKTETARPVLFIFNGGPGSASIWNHLGGLGPRRVRFDDPARPPTTAPFGLEANPYSLLDAADLVFIDPVLTGFSRLLPGGSPEEFLGTTQDARAFAEFIGQWLTRHGRWNSPKLIVGASYGTTRAIALASALMGGVFPPQGSLGAINLNGLVILGPALGGGGPPFAGNDRPAISELPTMAATAWYHGRLPASVTSVEAAIEAAHSFARSEYLAALDAGHLLDAATRERLANRLAELTGVPADAWLAANLRLGSAAFRARLLQDNGLEVGAYDARFTLPAGAGGGDPVVDEASMGQYTPGFVAAFNHMLSSELGLRPNARYVPIEWSKVNFRWDFGAGPGIPVARNDATALARVMRRNPALQVFVGAGYYDFATTLGAAEYALAHAPIPRERLQFKGYPSGHIPFLGEDSARTLATDLRNFLRSATRQAAAP